MPALACLAVAAVLAIWQAAPPQPAQATRGTAIVRGQVTDRETGVPIPRALVTMRLMTAGMGGPVFQNLTDADGQFEFANLPGGSFEVSATGGEHRGSHVRETFQPMPSGGYRSLMLKDGEVKPGVDFALRRSLAISGRVVDEFGDPMTGIRLRVTGPGGAPPQAFVRTRTTDDRGAFRIFGLPPGRYVVCAEVQRFVSPPSAAGARPDRFVSTCHPSALSESEAQVVTLAGLDVDGVEIRVRRLKTYSISGIVLDSNGAPAESAAITFSRFERGGGSSSTRTPAESRFRFTDLVPGEYAVEASVGLRQGETADTRPAERGFVSVKLDEHDVTDVVVMMKKPATVQGRVAFDDPAAAPQSGLALSVAASREGRSFAPQIRPAQVGADLSFRLKDLFDPVRLSVEGLPPGWVVKSIAYRGEDVTDRPVELTTDPRHHVDIVLTSRLAYVSGAVADDSGNPAAGAAVILLPAGTTAAPLYRQPMRRASKDGRFELPGVRSGDYLLIAVPAAQYDALRRESNATIAPLIRQAERITLVENDRLTMSLRVVQLPESK